MTHPANGQPLLFHAATCGACLHYDATLARCVASKDWPTTAPTMAACIRFLPRGRVGRMLEHVARHPRTSILMNLGAVASVAAVVVWLAIRW